MIHIAGFYRFYSSHAIDFAIIIIYYIIHDLQL